ncbi:hypothetical protein MKZ38_007083 [Zalerion maritima]|uniref:PXA domain-containing protein n=1 Tax=Zalerion maritima TaxID=339359 RepID=A0AAD5RIV2_9PEZI|nr:hypothetical protein MKZ38_007083 [Zalerion maritima]
MSVPNVAPREDNSLSDDNSLAKPEDTSATDEASHNDHADPPEPTETPKSSAPPPAGMTREEIVNAALKFLSNADASTLGAVAAGLAATTYFILGRIGLVLIGAFGGVVLIISWERQNPEVSRAMRGEKGVDVLERLLHLRLEHSTASDGIKLSEEKEDGEQQISSFEDFQPETSEALNGLVDAIIGDYVKWWYTPIVPADKAFPLSCRKTLTNFIVTMSQHISRKRPADAFLDLLMNSSSMVVVFFGELANAFADVPADSDMTAVDAVYNYLASNSDCRLANLLSQKQQANKFRMISEDLLGFLDRSIYDCDPPRVFLREVLAGVILEMTLQTCSKPEWINGWIVYLLEAGEPDFNQAIDVGMQTGTDFGDLDGNVGNVAVAKVGRKSAETERPRHQGHGKKLSRSVEETEEVMAEEAKKLNQMILEEEEKRKRESNGPAIPVPNGKTNSIPRSSQESVAPKEPRDRASTITTTRDSGKHMSDSPAQLSPQGILQPVGHLRSDAPESPISPVSPHTTAPPAQFIPAEEQLGGGFTSFDQFVPQNRLQIPEEEEETRKPPALTLHNAKITIYDDAPNDKGRMRTKPNWDYLVQVEPTSGHYPGWMIVRKYSDFETLHEILRRVATISGASPFIEQHSALPNWKSNTREALRAELERYVRNACGHQALAETEGMKRFFEKSDQGGHARSESKPIFGIETFGKNMLGALTNAPKGAFEGSKAVVGGVTGVFGNIGLGPKKAAPVPTLPTETSNPNPTPSRIMTSTPPSLASAPSSNRNSMPTLPRMDSLAMAGTGSARARDSMDSQRSSIISVQPGRMPQMERQPSHNSQTDGVEHNDSASLKPRTSDTWGSRSPTTAMSSRNHSRASSLGPLRSPSTTSLDGMVMRLPPKPSDMTDDFTYSPVTSEAPSRMDGSGIMSKHESFNSTTFANTAYSSPSRSLASPPKTAQGQHGNGIKGNSENKTTTTNGSTSKPKEKERRQFPPLSEAETRIAVELVFTMINELYTLSSAWNVRRAILMTGKSFLLRPGNPSLLNIQDMIQSSLLSSFSSDSSIANQIRKIRENSLPTEEERKKWPQPMTLDEKEKLRIKARRLLIESGVPTALTGVMGMAATGEAVGRVFDALQIEEVARGLVFGIMLQGVRILTH